MRIALIHALKHSPAPTEAAFAALWPEARQMHLLDTSLSADLAEAGGITPAMTERFLTLARYAAGTGARGILFTCSAFGPCIEACAAELAPLPVLKPNEAMIAEVAAKHRRVGLLATFPGTLASMPAEFPPEVEVVPMLAEGALAALDAGAAAEHDRLVEEAARRLAPQVEAIALAQFSIAHCADRVAAATGLPVYTTPASAVARLRSLLGASAPAL
ncbi:MAG: aspartate/glutamate racemase family protein [Rhodovarius sp.]|nr:aspartate/glutamate racemase family protein [Rhodovarius sp.]MDW8315423.1 aspartate/glutamate racemase family protein [Rhodovarius sp.]